jgi:hypothetical protein
LGEHGEHGDLVSRPPPLPRRGAAIALAALLALSAAPAGAACSLALALALDVSSSVDEREYGLQAEGLATALEDAEVQEAILAQSGAVYAAVFEWSGRRQQALVADWTALDAPAAIAGLAARVRDTGRSHLEYPTALGHALGYAASLMKRAPACGRRVLDISGDGENNAGYGPEHAYNAFDFDGVTVNALVVGGAAQPELIRYFQTEVIRGPGAFTVTAYDYQDYARAMKRKLLREIRPPVAIGLVR